MNAKVIGWTISNDNKNDDVVASYIKSKPADISMKEWLTSTSSPVVYIGNGEYIER